jgi:hypothetical protein
MATSDLSNLVKLHELLRKRGVDLIVKARHNRVSACHFVLSISEDHISEHSTRGAISPRQMKLLEREIQEHLKLEVEWVITPSTRVGVFEKALLELFETRYPGAVSSVILSSLKATPLSVWVEQNPSSIISLDKIDDLIKEFFLIYAIDARLVNSGEGDLPTNPVVLRNLKIYAPVTTERLAQTLQSKSFLIPSVHWLQVKLDKLRKLELIIRSKEGDYSLTEQGLTATPYGPYRLSSDVDRALALGKRKWQ